VAQKARKVAGGEVEDRGGIAELGVPDVEAVAFGAGGQFNTVGVIVNPTSSALAPNTAKLHAT